MRKEIKKAPTIRFRGFTEDWEQRKLGELATFNKGAGYSNDVTKDPSEKQDNQDALKKATHPKEYRKDHPHIGLKYWPKLLDSLREFYVQHLQKLLER